MVNGCACVYDECITNELGAGSIVGRTRVVAVCVCVCMELHVCVVRILSRVETTVKAWRVRWGCGWENYKEGWSAGESINP